jgi:hypothetical protein
MDRVHHLLGCCPKADMSNLSWTWAWIHICQGMLPEEALAYLDSRGWGPKTKGGFWCPECLTQLPIEIALKSLEKIR